VTRPTRRGGGPHANSNPPGPVDFDRFNQVERRIDAFRVTIGRSPRPGRRPSATPGGAVSDVTEITWSAAPRWTPSALRGERAS